MRARLLLVVLLGCAARPSRPVSVSQPPATDANPPAVQALEPEPTGRLPAGVEPRRYALTLDVVPSRERFHGEVDITLRLEHPREGLWLHGTDLSVTDAQVREGTSTRAARWVPGSREGIASVRWEGALGPGEVHLHLVYDAPFNRQLEGLYRVDSGGDAYAFTQFEAISARRALPCFDEPRFKTPFELTVATEGPLRAITNTEETGVTDRPDGLRAHRFAVTERLPTYLLAFAVGPLDVVDAPPIAPTASRTRPLPFRGVAARGRGVHLRRALEDTPRIVRALEDYFGRAYPYSKLDVIAVPDFGPGAMENAGAITFREPLLLVRPDGPVDQARAMAHVMAHELAHHWFGDLVTLRWWDDIWLNESFATWMGARITEEVFPEHRQGMALLTGVHWAMGADALSSASQIRRPIETDDDLRGGSAAIVYQKGAAVLGMLERWLGAESFQRALRAYLSAHEHDVATSADLFAALAEEAGPRPLDATLRAFIDGPGVPLLRMDLAGDAGGCRVTVEQSRFALPAGSDARPGAWPVPLCVRVPEPSGTGLRTLCGQARAPRDELPVGPGACPGYFIPNADGAGYFRWTLTPERWRALSQATTLTAAERLSRVNNARAAFTAGTLGLGTLRPLLESAAADPERVVAVDPFPFWTRVVQEELSGAEAEGARREAARLYAPSWRSLGWTPRDGEDTERKLYRRDLASFLGLVLGDRAVLTEGARLGARWLAQSPTDPAAVPPELTASVLGMYVRQGGADAVERVLARFLASDDASLRFRLLAALGQASEPALSARVLPLALDPRLRVNELFAPLGEALGRGDVRDAAFRWLEAHIDALYARISRNARSGTPWLGARFCRREDQARVRALFAPRLAEVPGSQVQLDGALEAIAVCAAERERQGPSLAAAFGARRPRR
ncbi:MAG: M1 family metallopeptidase [Deltaproteobacteria bacterium]|nr:M1 family metallopeptidase [Deltaproteobacteria bacterium]